MEPSRFEKQLAFITEIDKLKYIQRKTRLFNSPRHENDAEHSWHLAMMVWVLSEHANAEVDLMKVFKMVLIHDIVEIDAGDTFLYDTQKNHSNSEEEELAAHRIFGLLPTDQAQEMIALWKEFEAGESPEAQYAKAIDRFAPVMQNLSNQGGTWAEYAVPYPTIVHKIKGIQKGSDMLWDYTSRKLEERVESGEVLRG